MRDWAIESGASRSWRVDRTTTAGDPLPTPARYTGDRPALAGSTQLACDAHRVLAWRPDGSGALRRLVV